MKIPDEMLSKGEEIVRHWWPKYKSGQWQERLAEQINEALQSSTADIVRDLEAQSFDISEALQRGLTGGKAITLKNAISIVKGARG